MNISKIPHQENCLATWADKHALHDAKGNRLDADLKAGYRRVAKVLAACEKPNERTRWESAFYEAMVGGAVPGGRILSNAGAGDHKTAVSLINCVVSGIIDDSIESIMQRQFDSVMTLKSGCGIGYEFSTLRPKGAFVNGAGASTSGPLSFMHGYDRYCDTISSAGGRRGAQMATFDISHPDVEEFIRAKREDGVLRKFNMSVLITEEFLEAVRHDEVWQYKWDGKPTGKTTKARDLWDLIMRSTYEYAEPGFLMIDVINHMNNLWFCEMIRATNPCVTGDTLILTRKGYKEIESLVGKEVEIWNGYEWSKVKPKVTGRNQKILDVEFSDGSTVPNTPYHKHVLKSGERIEAKDLVVGDQLEKWEFPVIEGKKTISTKKAYTQGFYSGDGDEGQKRIWLYEDKINLLPFLKVKTSSDQSNERQNRVMVRLAGEYNSKQFVPGPKYSVQTRLDWLAGLIDSDGTTQDGNVCVWSINRDFLMRVKLMLNTLGVNVTVAVGSKAGLQTLPDGKGGYKKYEVQTCYRLTLNKYSAFKLLDLGLNTHRVVIEGEAPNRSASRFITVTNVIERTELEDKVYCFNEPKNHTGIFNGIMTAQCGEQPLPPDGACLLGSIILSMFVRNPFTDKASFDWERFEAVVRVFNRMLDNVVEISGLPLPAQEKELRAKRRHGMGYMGLGTALALMKIEYGSPEAVKFTDEVTYKMALWSYDEGAYIAAEKGMAPVLKEKHVAPYTRGAFKKGKSYNGVDLFLESEYLKQFRETAEGKKMLERIKKHGCRYTHAISIAPTGTIAFGVGNNCSSGIEPSFSHVQLRNRLIEGKATKEQVELFSLEALAYKHWLETDADDDEFSAFDIKKLPSYFSTANSVHPIQHIDMQAAAQKWVDSSISKTINVPKDFPFEDFKELYMYAAAKGLKGCTTYRPNPRKIGTVLTTKEEQDSRTYDFTLEDGSVVSVKGGDKVQYQGQEHVAALLFEAIREGTFGKY